MSNFEEELGEITLPSAEVAPLKATLRTYLNLLHDKVRERSIELHKSFGTRSVSRYEDALSKIRASKQEQDRFVERFGRGYTGFAAPRHFPRARTPLRPEALVTKDLVDSLAERVLWHILGESKRGRGSIHVPTVEDVNRFAPKVTNRTKVFREGSYGYIAFEGRTVTWGVERNNHAVDSARNTNMARLFFDALEMMKWTARTGGVVLYRSEYHDESHDPYGFSDSIRGDFGPLGEKIVDARAKAQLSMMGIQ